MSYAVLVALGVVAGFLAARTVPRADDGLDPRTMGALRVAALTGAVIGAYAFEWPAQRWGLTTRTDAPGPHWLGRTVLGGLLGGWLAVELAKWIRGVRVPTGDRFALPLAIALAFGRLGCVVQGCCRGRVVDPGSWAGRIGLRLHGEPRFPATLVEAYVHALAAIVLVFVLRAGRLRGATLAAYLTLYAVVRFELENVRDAPAWWLGLTYYQWLCVVLALLAGGTWLRRSLVGPPIEPSVSAR